MKNIIAVMLLSTGLFFGQDKADKPKSESKDVIQMNDQSQNKILKAEKELDDIINQEQDIQLQVQNLVKKYQDLDSKRPQAIVKVNSATEDAWKESGLDKKDYNIDVANFTFTKKPVEKK